MVLVRVSAATPNAAWKPPWTVASTVLVRPLITDIFLPRELVT